MTKIEINRIDDAFSFEAKDANNHSLLMDAATIIGGNNTGFRPMQTLLAGLGGCSGVDILIILDKQRQEVKGYKMIITGEREEVVEPSLWKKVHIQFIFTGKVDPEKAEKACALSIDKYCSVAATLRAAGCTITWETRVESE